MVKWIGKFSLSLQRLKDAWMDNFPLSALAEYSTMGHIVLDMINLAYQSTTKSREQPGHFKKHVTFAMSERKPAYPAHAPYLHEDEDEDDEPLVRPTTRPLEEGRDQTIDDEDLAPLVPQRPPET